MATGLADSYRRGKSPVLPGGETKYLDQELRKLESQNIGTLKTLEQISKEVGDSKALIREERTIRVSENEAFAKKLTTLEAQTGDNAAKITEDRTVWTTRTQALAQAVDTLSASTDTELAKVRASIVDERTARTSATEALAQQVTTLTASIDNNSAWARTTTTALVTETESLAQRITELDASFASEVTDLKNADGSLTTRITSAEAAITTEQTARANADSALAQQITTLNASFTQEVSNRQSGDTALQGTLYTLTSRVQAEETARANADSALASQITSVSAAAARQRVFRQGTAPGSPQLGDLWYDTANDNIPKVWDGSSWVVAADVRVSQALSDAAAAQAAADGKIRSFYQTAAPTGLVAGDVGDLWFDTDDNNKIYRWSGTAWVAAQDSRIAQALLDAAGAQSTANGKVTSFFTANPPTATATGDLWFDSDDGNRLYRWSGTQWLPASDIRIDGLLAAVTEETNARVTADTALAQQISNLSAASTRQRIFRQSTAPGSPNQGDLWYDTSSNGRPKVYLSGSWVDAQDDRIPALQATVSSESSARVSADNALASQISTLNASVNSNSAAINNEATTRATADSALSSQISTLTSTVNGNTTSISTLTSSVNGVVGRYGVTINNNGHISGISLLSDSSNGSPSAVFRIDAERFAIRNPGSSVDSIFWDGTSSRLVVRGDIQATSLTANTVTSGNIVNGELGREQAYYDPNRVNVGTSGANVWADIAVASMPITFGRVVHGTVSFAARQTDGRNGAEHRVRVLRQNTDGSGDYICWGGSDGAPITTGYDGTTTSITFFDHLVSAGKTANYLVQMRTLFGDDKIAIVERSMFLRELSRSQQNSTVVPRTTTLPGPPSGYDGGSTFDPPPGTVIP